MLLVIAVAACQQNAGTIPAVTNAPITGLRLGALAPDFSAKLLTGSIVNLAALRGKVVLVNFWATWCGPCRVEMPVLQGLNDRFGAVGFKVLAVNNQEAANTIQPFLDKYGLVFDVALDQNGSLNQRYTVRSYPTSYVIGRDGVILAQQFGPFAPGDLDRYIGRWLNLKTF